MIVFAGTDGGVYRSIDGGVNFVEVNQGLSAMEVFDMEYAKICAEF